MAELNSKTGLATAATIVGLLVSLVGNYLEYRKIVSDADIAKQQIDIAQGQAATAREDLSLKQQELDALQATQNRQISSCNQAKAEHDDALKAVHTYDESITEHEANLQLEKGQLALAEASHDGFNIDKNRSLVELEESTVSSLTASRDEALARVRDIERECGP